MMLALRLYWIVLFLAVFVCGMCGGYFLFACTHEDLQMHVDELRALNNESHVRLQACREDRDREFEDCLKVLQTSASDRDLCERRVQKLLSH